MNALVLILTDFFSSTAPDDEAAPARLGALETLLARAQRLPDEHWRHWLARRLGVPASEAGAPASLAARLAGVDTDAQRRAWFATPVHYVAGMDGIRLHRHGLLSLTSDEQQQLVEDFERVFAGSGWRLQRIDQRELLLLGPALAADAVDPARLLGADPSAGLASGSDAGTLRRLGSEMEMWLHEHALNRARAARGALAVSSLWPWGASAPAAPTGRAASPSAALRLYGTDAVAAALQASVAAAPLALPGALDALPATSVDAAILLPTQSETPPASRFEQLERDWFAPALRWLSTRRVRELQLRFDQRGLRLTRASMLRVWRRTRPWWEALA